MNLRRICVFCGSSAGAHPDYAQAAHNLGARLANEFIELVYGGSKTGLMGVVADATLAAGGRVIGVLPRHLQSREVAHPDLSELRLVGSMHERKAVMADLADGFIGLPGGIGTLEEFFEVATWNQLGIHAKPTVLYNVRGYYELAARFLDHACGEGFLRPEHRARIRLADDLSALLNELRSFEPAAPGAPGTPEISLAPSER